MTDNRPKKLKGEEVKSGRKRPLIDHFPLSSRVQYSRETREFTQAELANKADVSQSTVAQIESGDKKPSVETLEKIARALDVNLAVFFAQDDIHVFDMARLRERYKSPADLNPTLYKAIGEVVRYAKEIGFPV
ncbi:MAG: helix-turn-helix domain-containing protein [Bdellovibrionales bacterium]|nr:helix-turn-helix domain-containing protein [Bdellovibrionales bacterium]